MNIQEIHQAARTKLKGFCRVCPECNGKACAGEMPGMGGVGTGAGFKHNVEALAAVRINLRTLHAAKTQTTAMRLFGLDLSAPILAAPITGVTFNIGGALSEEEWSEAVVQGAQAAGTLAMTGDAPNPVMYRSGVEAIKRANGRGIPVIKPREQEEAYRYMALAEEAGAVAVGMDVDAAGILPMALAGQPVGPKTQTELKALVGHTSLPFVVKGIMTADEAEIAAEAGAAAIVVSNHGGRVIDHTPGTAEVLPEIAARIKGRLAILIDGGVRNGVDVLKMLALGADAVLIGRPLLIAAAGGGREGVTFVLQTMEKELKHAMLMTGQADLSNLSPAIRT